MKEEYNDVIDLEELERYNGIYRELLEHFGLEVMMKLYSRYKGQSISFPMNLYDSDWKKAQIRKDYSEGASVRELAKKYQYSEQRIRIFLRTNSQGE